MTATALTEVKTDICVIGAGSGGLSVASGAAQMGARVVLIEGGEMGGDCLNVGCVPSKALLAGARAGMSFEQAMSHVRATIARIAPHDSQTRFEGLGCHVIRAKARFAGPSVVEAGPHRIRARRFVIATGSRPFVPPVPGLSEVPYLTNETLWSLPHCPSHLVILGGGPIGVEMAQAFRGLGAEVTLIEARRLLGREDPEAVAYLRDRLQERGVALREGVQVTQVSAEAREAGDITVTLEDGSEVMGSHLLVATGRQPTLEALNLSSAGVEADAGGVRVDAHLRSTNRRVYAIGDVVSGGARFTHVAGAQASMIVRALMFGLPARFRGNHIPHVTYTDPELAQVGLTEAEARDKYGNRLRVEKLSYQDNDRAIAMGQGAAGFIKLMVVKGRPVGVTLVGPQAGELIATWALTLSAGLPLRKIAGMVAPYPTLSELNKRVAGAYLSPQLFDNVWIKRVVRGVQKWLP